MFCKNCGKPTPDGQNLCPECAGGNMQLNQNPAPKKSSKKLLLIGGIALVAVVAIVLAVVLLGGGGEKEAPYVPFEGTAQEHIEYVENREITQLADELTDAYSSLFSSGSLVSSSNPASLSGYAEMHLILGDALLEAAKNMSGVDMDLGWLKDLKLRMDAATKNDMLRYMLSLGLGKNDVLSLDMLMDMAGGKMYMAIPELNKQYLMMDMAEAGIDMDAMGQFDQLFVSMDFPMPTEDEFRASVESFLNALVSCVEATGKADDTLTVGGVSQQVIRIDSVISQQDLMTMAIDALRKAEKEGAFRDLFNQMDDLYSSQFGMDVDMGSSYNDFYTEFQQGLRDLERQRDEMSTNGDSLKLTTYLDKKDQVVGRILELAYGNGGSDVVYASLSATDGTNTSHNINLLGMLTITGDTVTKKNTTSGTFDFSVAGESMMTVKVKDYYSKGDNMRGDFQFIPSAYILNEMLSESDFPVGMISTNLSLRLKANVKKNSGEYGIFLEADNQTLLGLEVKGGNGTKLSVSVPKNAADGSDSFAMQSWAFSMDIFGFINKLEKAGVPSEIINELY